MVQMHITLQEHSLKIKKEMLEKIGWLTKHPENARPEGLRGF